MKLHVICIAYEQPIPLRMLCDSFLLQTDHRWDLQVIHDGPPSPEIIQVMENYNDSRIHFIYSPERVQHWGNPLRRSHLANLDAEIDDYVLLTNHDNIYVPRFVEFMLGRANMDTGIVFCNTVHNHLTYSGQVSELKVGKVDGGALIVLASLAKEVGYKHDVGHADGLYARGCRLACVKKSLNIVHINKFLFIHN
jgi:hypothetical protein